jgi:hypothetical protein
VKCYSNNTQISFQIPKNNDDDEEEKKLMKLVENKT